MDDLTLKWLHVLSAAVLFGGGLGSAFHLFASSLRRKPAAAASAAGNVLLSDALFTGPSAVFQVASGLWLAHRLGLPTATPWIAWSLGLYAFAMLIWLPVLWLEFQLRRIARQADAAGQPLPPAYWTRFAWWAVLGAAGFMAFVGVFWLMVAKRLPWH